MRSFKTADEKLLEQAEIGSVFYAGNLHEALKNNWPVETVLNYRRWAAQGYLTLGEFDQADMFVRDVPELADLAADIAEARQAEAADDDEHCDCRHVVDSRLGENEPARLMEVSSYGERFRFFSKRHGQVVKLFKCAICGHVNAHPDSPDKLFATGVQLRRAADKQAREFIRATQGQGKMPSSPLLADRNSFPDAT